jgi:hypothetical protein
MQWRTFVLTAVLAVAATHCGSETDDPDWETDEASATGAGGGAGQDDGESAAAPGPAIVEAVARTLAITSPERAAFIEASDAPLEVVGSGATPGLMVNGEPATVAADGTFTATVLPKPGLNLIVAADGDARVESPYLYGQFASATTPVPQAVTVSLSPSGINAPAPATSVTSVVNEALKGRDLMSSLRGQTFSGTSGPASWSYRVTSTRYGRITVALSPRTGGLNVGATVTDAYVTGTLTLRMPFNITYSRTITVSASRTTVTGPTNLSVVKSTGELRAVMPTASASMSGFRLDSGNAGLPCCVDDIATRFLRPRVENALRDGVRQHVPRAIGVTLGSLGLPKNLEFPGLVRPVPIKTKFDDGSFLASGITLTASGHFGRAFTSREPGAAAPGWLTLGQPFVVRRPTTPFGVSVSLDGVNQILFAIWGNGSLTRSVEVPQVASAKVGAELPPLLQITGDGDARVGLGELLVDVEIGGKRYAAATTIIQDVRPRISGLNLLLTPTGEPTVSITWLGDGVDEKLRPAEIATGVAAVAKEAMLTFLRPLRIPLPRAPLDAAGPTLVGRTLALSGGTLALDPKAARITVQGSLALRR